MKAIERFRRIPLLGLLGWLDPPLTIALILLGGMGLTVLYSASGGSMAQVIAQGLRLVAGFGAMTVIAAIAPARLRRFSPWLFGASLIVLALVPILGSGRSARSWIDLGIFHLQPSELLKLTVPLAVAAWLARRPLPPRIIDLAIAGLLIVAPAVAIAVQPDLGTAVVVGASGVLVVFLAGLRWWQIALGVVLSGALAPFGWQHLHEYQKARIMMFLDPQVDALGSGYNVIQAQIAVGSGGMGGKGWLTGTQSRLDFLPEQTTDFIFAVLAEEFGFIGVAAVLALYAFVILRCLYIAMLARDRYGQMLAGALGLTFALYVVLNGGMVAGLLPVVGVPMPLLSYGGTSAVSLLASLGIVMSIHAWRRAAR